MSMELNQIVEAEAVEVLSFGIRFNYQGESILVKSPELSWYPGPLDEDESIKVGEKASVKILHKLESEYTGSVREAHPEENPWIAPPAIGDTSSGTVVITTEYGYVIRLSKTLLGLLLSENTKNTYNVGQRVAVEVIDVDTKRKKISLIEQC
ncbi:hypothetical protein MAH1_36900 [Sessilibacter sp. MAH1]